MAMAKIRDMVALERILDTDQALATVTNHVMRVLDDHSNLNAIKGLELHRQLNTVLNLRRAALSQ